MEDLEERPILTKGEFFFSSLPKLPFHFFHGTEIAVELRITHSRREYGRRRMSNVRSSLSSTQATTVMYNCDSRRKINCQSSFIQKQKVNNNIGCMKVASKKFWLHCYMNTGLDTFHNTRSIIIFILTTLPPDHACTHPHTHPSTHPALFVAITLHWTDPTHRQSSVT